MSKQVELKGNTLIVRTRFDYKQASKVIVMHKGEKAKVFYSIDNAPTIKPPEVLYLCDGHGCSAMCGGKSEYCKHTSNIESAKNFESITGGDRCIYVEKDEKTTNGGDDTKGGKE